MLSRSALHAVKAVRALAELAPGEYAGATALAEEIDAPPNYLSKLLQTLARNGVLASRKGLGGGFRPGRDPATISLYDVVAPIDDLDRWNGCFLGGACVSSGHKPGHEGCAVHRRWAPVRDAYLELLRNSCISEIGVPEGGQDAQYTNAVADAAARRR